MSLLLKPYISLFVFAILSTLNVAQADVKQNIILNNKNVIELYNSQSTKPKEIENTLNLNEYLFELINLKYKLNTTLDFSKQHDQTDSLSTSLQQNNDLNKATWLLSKRFLSGTTLGLELSQLNNTYGTFTSPLNTDANQNYLAVSFDQPVFPNFFGSQDRSLLNSASNDFKLKKIQSEFDQMTAQKEILQIFWKSKSLAVSVEENKKLMTDYQKLANKAQEKKSHQFASAGELEQALSEFETKKQSLKSDQTQLEQTLLSLKTILNIAANTTVEFDPILPQFKCPEFSNYEIQHLKKFQYQQLKFKSAQEQLSSVENSNLPLLSLYGKYTQSGYDPSNSKAWDEATNSNYQKYLVGLKLDYTFDNNKSELDRKIKSLNLEIEKNKTMHTDLELNQQIEIARQDLINSFEQIASTQKILELRKKSLKDISKNYFQGRTDISFLIDAYNKKNLAEVSTVNSIGDYETKKIDYDMLVLE